MQELRESTDIAGDGEALRARIRDDGYIFLRRFLDPEMVRGVGEEGAAVLQGGGWTAPGPDPVLARPLEPVRAVAMRDAASDPSYRRFAALEGFNHIPFLGAFEDLMHRVMGPAGFCYPRKVVRVVYPRSMVPKHPGAVVHKDFNGVQDVFTCWVPLADVSVTLGGLAVLPGSQHWVQFLPRTIARDERAWRTTDYSPGDVLVFHCLTSHAALPNDGSHLRLSAEYRWQCADRPAPRFMVEGANGREFLSPLLRGTRWWRPVPSGLQLVDMDASPEARRARRAVLPEPSRFVDFTLRPPRPTPN